MRTQDNTTHQSRRPARWRVAAAALTLLAATLVGAVTAAQPASANCNGVGAPYTLYTFVNSVIVAYDTPAETCDGNSQQVDFLVDNIIGDSFCAYVTAYSPVAPFPLEGGLGPVCNTSIVYTYTDPQFDSFAAIGPWFTFPTPVNQTFYSFGF